MPIYVYRCRVCGSVDEVLQKADDPAPVCGGWKCKAAQMVKMPAAASFEISGEGVYKPGFSRAGH